MSPSRSMSTLLLRKNAYIAFLLLTPLARADLPLLGNQLPHPSLNDGDFDQVRAHWRQFAQSPCWTPKFIPGKGTKKVGLDMGKIFGGGNEAVDFDSIVLTGENSAYSKPVAGDVLQWAFAARAEYPCDARVSMSLGFGAKRHLVADQKSVPGGHVENAIFSGSYTISEEDAKQADLFVRLTLHATEDTKVYVDYADLKVLRKESAGPATLSAKPVDSGIELRWPNDSPDSRYHVYRSSSPRKDYQRIATGVSANQFIDSKIIHGLTHYYFVTRAGEKESAASPVEDARKVDTVPPHAPSDVTAIGDDTVIQLRWKSSDKDIRRRPHAKPLMRTLLVEVLAPPVEALLLRVFTRTDPTLVHHWWRLYRNVRDERDGFGPVIKRYAVSRLPLWSFLPPFSFNSRSVASGLSKVSYGMAREPEVSASTQVRMKISKCWRRVTLERSRPDVTGAPAK